LIIKGNIIISADGQEIVSRDESACFFEGKKPGDTVELTRVEDNKKTNHPTAA